MVIHILLPSNQLDIDRRQFGDRIYHHCDKYIYSDSFDPMSRFHKLKKAIIFK